MWIVWLSVLLEVGRGQSTESCCCGRAVYRVYFEGTWDRKFHQFPDASKGVSTWTDPSGASHSAKFSIFHLDRPTPDHLRLQLSHDLIRSSTFLEQHIFNHVCTPNSPPGQFSVFHLDRPTPDHLRLQLSHDLIRSSTFLEQHIFNHSSFVRTVLRMPDVDTPRGKATAQLSVTPTHHLISFLALMQPTSDWFVGLDSESLCAADCTWLANATYNLFPLDAGVFKSNSRQHWERTLSEPDSGRVTYVSKDQLNLPHREDLAPIARLTLIRTGSYPNQSCSFLNDSSLAKCVVTEWSGWSPCLCPPSSVDKDDCPQRYHHRSRALEDPRCCHHPNNDCTSGRLTLMNESQKCAIVPQ